MLVIEFGLEGLLGAGENQNLFDFPHNRHDDPAVVLAGPASMRTPSWGACSRDGPLALASYDS